MKTLLESLFFPPGVFILFAAAALLYLRRAPRAATAVLSGALGLLFLCSLPLSAAALMTLLQTQSALTAAQIEHAKAQAIVVLAAGRRREAPEYGGDTLSPLALERLRYAVHLHRQTGLPLILSGGSPEGREPAEALLLKEAAVNDFAVPVLLTEESSRTTWENATHTAALLRERGIEHVYLVTHAWHMPRARWSFERTGLHVTPAPTAFVTAELNRPGTWLPSAQALHTVRLAFHELLGLVWYRLSAG